MPPPPKPPALSDAELRETMNLLGAVVASMSERLDHQTRVTETLLKAAEATFTMAVAAKKQTDPARFAEELGNKIDAPIWKIIDAFTRLHNRQFEDARSAKRQAEDLLDAQRDAHDKIHDWVREHTAHKKRLLFVAIPALLLVLGLSIALPRFLVGYGPSCAAMGGLWTRATTGDQVCVFYAGR